MVLTVDYEAPDHTAAIHNTLSMFSNTSTKYFALCLVYLLSAPYYPPGIHFSASGHQNDRHYTKRCRDYFLPSMEHL